MSKRKKSEQPDRVMAGVEGKPRTQAQILVMSGGRPVQVGCMADTVNLESDGPMDESQGVALFIATAHGPVPLMVAPPSQMREVIKSLTEACDKATVQDIANANWARK